MTSSGGSTKPNAPTSWANLVLFLSRGMPRRGRQAYHARAAIRSMRRGRS